MVLSNGKTVRINVEVSKVVERIYLEGWKKGVIIPFGDKGTFMQLIRTEVKILLISTVKIEAIRWLSRRIAVSAGKSLKQKLRCLCIALQSKTRWQFSRKRCLSFPKRMQVCLKQAIPFLFAAYILFPDKLQVILIKCCGQLLLFHSPL